MQIIDRKETPTLSVRYRTPLTELSQTMGTIYGEIASFMGARGIPFSGPPFAMYHNMDMNDLDVEIGFPLTTATAGKGRIAAGRLPGGAFATAKHTGPYSAIEETYNELMAYVKGKSRELENFMFEEYLNSPENTPPEKLETMIYFPLKRA